MKKVNYKKGLWTNRDTNGIRPQYYGTEENEHHYHVLESLHTHQIFRMPLSIMVNGDHRINEYWECPQSENEIQ